MSDSESHELLSVKSVLRDGRVQLVLVDERGTEVAGPIELRGHTVSALREQILEVERDAMTDDIETATIEDDDRISDPGSDSVVRSWVSTLPFRMQATLLSALRGCDGRPKEDPSKPLTRALRSTMLRHAISNPPPGSFMGDQLTQESIGPFLRDLDHYPVHFLTHFMHACQIVGYEHPDRSVRVPWLDLYAKIVSALHLAPEGRSSMRERLGPGDLG